MSLKDVIDARLHEFDTRYAKRYYGKYRAIVTSVSDPSNLGRIKVQVPVLFGKAESAWCWPAASMGGNNRDAPHGKVELPDVGDMVWVELEEGNTQKAPIWTGGMWSTESIPDHSRAFPDDADSNPVKGVGVIPESSFNASETGKVRIWQMASGARIEFDETEGEERVQIFHKSGSHIEMLRDGTINIGALENLRFQATDGSIFTFAGGDSTEEVLGAKRSTVGLGEVSDVTGDRVHSTTSGGSFDSADGPHEEVGQSMSRDVDGDLVEFFGKETRTVANQSSTMVGTDWFVQASGAASLVAQNSATNGGTPTDLGLDLTAMNSRAVLQSTDLTGLASKARLELSGIPGTALLEALLITLSSVPEGVGAVRPVPYGDTLLTILTTMMTLFDTHVHPALGNAPPPISMTPFPQAGALLPLLNNVKLLHGP